MSEKQFCIKCFGLNEDQAEQCAVCGAEMNEASPAHHLPARTVLKGRYLTGLALGEGGFGITYVGYDLLLQSKVAIKEYFPSNAANRSGELVCPVQTGEDSSFQRGKKHFMREANILISLQEVPNIVRIKDYFEENGTAYIIMEYLDGCDLRSYIRENGAVKFDKAFELLSPLMKILGDVHEKGIIHRDISPSNIMLLNNGEIRLLDFGAATKADEEGTEFDSLLIKNGYAPPEQYRNNETQGAWTDVYALCATFYMLISGKEPESAADRAYKDTLALPRRRKTKMNPKQESVLLRGLELDSRKRIPSMPELERQFQDSEKAGFEYAKLLVPLFAAAAVFVAVLFFAGKTQPEPAATTVESPAVPSASTQPDLATELPDTERPRPSVVLPDIVRDEPLLPDAHPVQLFEDMVQVEGFEKQILIDNNIINLIAEECWRNKYCLSLVCRYQLRDIEAIDQLSAYVAYPETYMHLDFTRSNGNYLYDITEPEGYLRIDIFTALLASFGIEEISDINIGFYWYYNNHADYGTIDYNLSLPAALKLEKISTPARISFADLSFKCHGAVLFSDGKGEIIFETERCQEDISIRPISLLADGKDTPMAGSWSTGLSGRYYISNGLYFSKANYHDENNIVHVKGGFPKTLCLTLAVIHENYNNQTTDGLVLYGSIELNFDVDENGVCTLRDYVSNVYPTEIYFDYDMDGITAMEHYVSNAYPTQ